MMMAGLFLMLLGGVGFIQDKRFFSSAPQQVQDAVPDSKPERFPGQRAIGWMMIILSFVLMGGAIVLGAWDGIRNGFGFWQFALRFFIMLLLLKAFDILFFDWFLLCNAGLNFFPHFYPETKDILAVNSHANMLRAAICPVIIIAGGLRKCQISNLFQN